MAENYRVAPIMAFYGNPNIPNGAGMHFLGLTRGDATVSPNLNIATGKADQVGTSPIATAVWASGHAPQATLPLIDEDIDKLVEYVLGSEKLSAAGVESWGIGSGFTRIESIGTLALVPVNELGVGTNGIDSPNSQWFPAAVCTNFGDLVNNLPEGNDAFQPHDAVFMATYLDFDDRKLTAVGAARAGASRTLLPKSHRVFFKGSPRSMEMVSLGGVGYAVPSWSLPAVALA